MNQSFFLLVKGIFQLKKTVYLQYHSVKKAQNAEKIKENEKKMSFGKINGEGKCNILCNNELYHFLSLARNISAQYSFELYLTN